jgi:hypothetical protein
VMNSISMNWDIHMGMLLCMRTYMEKVPSVGIWVYIR